MNTASPRIKLGVVARAWAPFGALTVCAMLLAACASQPTRYVGSGGGGGGRGFDPLLGVYASPRLVEDGQPVPRGGGSYLVGRPYTIAGRAFYPTSRPEGYTVVGTASWYGDAFHGRRTANGEIFDKNSISAAHPTLPLPSYVRVTNTTNGRSMIVRVNDRGPYHGGRVMDVSQRVAEALSFKGQGTARIRVEYIGRASLGGSDDSKLLATLREDGMPAQLDGSTPSPTMLADERSPEAPLPLPPVGPAVGQVERFARAEQDVVSEEVLPPRRRAPAPVPPQRPFDVAPESPLVPQERAQLDRLIRNRATSSAIRPAPLVSFAVSDGDAPEQASVQPSRRTRFRRADTTVFDDER